MRDSYIFYKDRLEAEYLKVFEQIEMYVSSRYGDEETREERLGELLDIFLNSQQAGKSPESVTGHNLEKFCENFCEDFGAKQSFLFLADWIFGIAWFFFLESLVDVMFFLADSGGNVFPAILHMPRAENILGYFIGFILSIVIAAVTKAVTRRIMFRTKRVPLRQLKALSGAAALISFAAVFIVVSTQWTGDFSCPQIVICIVSGIYLLFYYRFRKREKTDKVRFSDMLVQELEKTMPEDLEKKFQKDNQKRRKCGKSEITFEEFAKEEEKRCRREEKLCNLEMYLCPVLCLMIGYAITYFCGGFEGISDIIWFTVIILAIEGAIMFGMRGMMRVSVTARKKWLLSYRESKNEEE